ncbi:VWA domain-containing protein [Yinghuangia sp. YIM S09857]|uniref:VWA domain-containing protein n=1 Tax=Yinghuangia sp. YIM S09857 TaxID=3436929 RepID=UPI003F52AE6A
MNIRNRRTRAAVLVLPALVLGSLLPAATAHAAPTTRAAPAAGEGGPPPKMELVLDLSGSMKENDAGGQTRLAAAKQAVGRIIDTAPSDAALGLRVYGATYPGEDKALGCADTQQLFPVALMDAAARTAAKQRVAGMDAVGFTPIGVSLREAAKDVGTDGKRRIVLVSDGEDTCAPPPPCDVARELKAQGIDLAVDVVGFKTTGAARDQLKCIAQVSGGEYADAADADALTANLSTLFRRAWTTYNATGTPVTASTTNCAEAPLIGPGQYLDAVTTGGKQYYRVKKTPGQILQVSATVALTPSIQHSNIEVVAGPMTPTGDPRGWMRAFSQSTGWANVLSVGGRTEAPRPGATPDAVPGDEGCVMIANHVTDPKEKRFPFELQIGLADADPAKSAGRSPAAPPPRTGADATGGFSFNSATPIGAGTHRQSIAVGEWPIWRVDLKAGQRLTVKGGAQVPADLPYSPNSGLGVLLFNPQRDSVGCSADRGAIELIGSRTGRVEKVCDTWEIAKPGDTSTKNAGFTEPGTYYIALGLGSLPADALGTVVPVDLTVAIDGTPRDEPRLVFDFDGTPDAAGTGKGDAAASGAHPGRSPGADDADIAGQSAASKADDKSGAEKLALPLGIAAAVLLLAGAGYYGLRRR